MKRVELASLLFLLGCGGSTSQATAHGAGHEHHHAADAPGPVGDFHGALAPLWHADQGPERAESTCAAVADLRAKALRVVESAPADPAPAEEAAWRQAATDLQSSVEALGTACAAPGRPEFEARFHAVHEAFHRLHETSGASGSGSE